MKKKFMAALAMLALATSMFTGCGASTQTVSEKTPEVSQEATGGAENNNIVETKKGTKISIVGSTTIAEPMEKLVAAYKEAGSTDDIEVQGNGSSAGIKAAIDGTADIGMASRELSEEEKASGLNETVIAYDGIAVVVNPTNTVTALTQDQVKDIFEGKITNWKDVGGNDQDIIVVTREAGSGTRGAFEEIVGLLDDSKASTIADTALVSEGTGAVMATVASKEASIGFISLGYMDDTVKALDIDGVTPTTESVKAGDYKISRPLLLVAQPTIKPEAQAVIDFITGNDGQEIMSEKYISIK